VPRHLRVSYLYLLLRYCTIAILLYLSR